MAEYKTVQEIKRQLPLNLKEKDWSLFEASVHYNPYAPDVKFLRNAQVIKGKVFSWRPLRFYHWYTNILKVSGTKTIKSLFSLAKRPIVLPHAIWITHEWTHDYFHWLTDALCRLIIVPESFAHAPVLLPSFYEQKPYVTDSLRMLNYKWQFYENKKRLSIKTLAMPGHLAMTGNYNEPVLQLLRNRFFEVTSDGSQKNPYRKIYISRVKAGKRYVLNEKEVVSVMKQFEYEIHCLEDYSFKQQIELMQETRILAGLHGGGLTNMLFMPTGGTILELRNNLDSWNNCYFSMASALNQHFYYLRDKDPFETGKADVLVDIKELQQCLQMIEAGNSLPATKNSFVSGG